MGAVRLILMVAQMAAILAFWLVPEGARAHTHEEPKFVPQCNFSSSNDVALEEMIGNAVWMCEDRDWDASKPVAWLRFDAEAWAGESLPRYFYTRIARHEAISFAAVDNDGTIRSARFLEEDGRPFAAGPVFQLDLPEVTEDTSEVIVRIERPHSVPLLTEARLAHHAEDAEWTQVEMMMLALVIGMLVLPLLFDISFFVVLRERFVAIHALMVVAMMIYVSFAGGLVTVFAQLPIPLMAVVGALFWAIGCGISAFFLVDFLEDGAQSELMTKLTLITGAWTIVVPGFFALQLHTTQPVDDFLYFVTFIPALVVLTAAIGEAVLRGSRSARFLALAWTPIILASVERLLRGLGIYVGPSSLDQMLYLATGIEVVVMSLAIADRFLAIRRERDAALTEARMLEDLSERDPLTGLMNRRAVEARFPSLRTDGFDTFALLDLDHFKEVNDEYGHQVGDKALIACANALRGGENRDTIAVRMGGEEFAILMRGKNSIDRTEAMRRLVPVRIAREVEGLDHPVTASMGVVEFPRHTRSVASFDEMYARADKLLYEAKESGRNRTSSERIKVFNAAPLPRAANESA